MRSVNPTSRPRSTGRACVTSSADAATYDTFQPSPSRKSDTDIEGMETTHASITVETAMTARPAMSERRRPTRSIELPDDEHEPEHPDDVQADHREDVGLLVLVADDDVAGQIHHAGHDREARQRRDDGRGHARPAQDLSERRRRLGGWVARRDAGALELERDRARVGPDE